MVCLCALAACTDPAGTPFIRRQITLAAGLTPGQSAQLTRAFRQRIIGASATESAQRSTDIPRLPWRKLTFLLALARLPGQYHHQARG